MVQRKLGNQADHIKPTLNLKPYSSPSQNHDMMIIKNKGVADLKKKMMKKKSSKTKVNSEYESCRSPRHVPQPGKPPTIKQQQSPASTPNYMKSTSSSVARKEVSSQTYSPDNKRKNSKNSKLGSASSATRSLARTSSLKLVRTTLTKTPSFKAVSAKKKTPLVLSEKKATCSSTLKESKFPSYLELSPGGTESDGTSAFKVCPYTYCSLNGHHHPPLPPLKCFMSARRRALKTQRNFKLGCLSPRQPNQSVPSQKLNAAEVPPLTNEDEFFLEIYSNEQEEMAHTAGRNTDDYVTADSDLQVPAKHCDGQVEESLSDGPQHSGEDNLEAEINIPYMPLVDQEEADVESFSMHTELEIEDAVEELSSEASDMDWDVDNYYTYIEDEVDDSFASMAKSSDPACCYPQLLSGNTLEDSLDAESIISETGYGYDDSKSACSHGEFEGDQVSNPRIFPQSSGGGNEDTSYNVLEISEITEKLEEEICKGYVTIQDDDAIALKGNQELNICNFNEEQDDNVGGQNSSDENLAIKMEETKTDCCEQGNGNVHCNSDEQLVVGADLKSKTNYEDHTRNQDEDGTEGDPTPEACVEKVNRIKDAPRFKEKKTGAEYDMGEELSESCRNLRGIARRNDIEESEESREFNPRPPNFLPLEADPEAEKVNLKHQMMDDEKNAEDWMLDFALRRAVDKLAPARKRKVALLVEAFETVMPISKWEPHHRRSTAQFAHPRPIQACN